MPSKSKKTVHKVTRKPQGKKTAKRRTGAPDTKLTEQPERGGAAVRVDPAGSLAGTLDGVVRNLREIIDDIEAEWRDQRRLGEQPYDAPEGMQALRDRRSGGGMHGLKRKTMMALYNGRRCLDMARRIINEADGAGEMAEEIHIALDEAAERFEALESWAQRPRLPQGSDIGAKSRRPGSNNLRDVLDQSKAMADRLDGFRRRAPRMAETAERRDPVCRLRNRILDCLAASTHVAGGLSVLEHIGMEAKGLSPAKAHRVAAGYIADDDHAPGAEGMATAALNALRRFDAACEDAAAAIDEAEQALLRIRKAGDGGAPAPSEIRSALRELREALPPPLRPVVLDAEPDEISAVVGAAAHLADAGEEAVRGAMEAAYRRVCGLWERLRDVRVSAGGGETLMVETKGDGGVGDPLSWEMKAIALCAKYPVWTANQIAEACGVDRGTLYRNATVRRALQGRKAAMNTGRVRPGRIVEGRVEAEDDSD